MPHFLTKTAVLGSIIGFIVSACGGGEKIVLEQRTLSIGGDQVSLCIDPRLTSKELGLVDFEKAPSADAAGLNTLVGVEVRTFGPQLPPVQFNQSWDKAGKICNPNRPEDAEVYKMGAGKFPNVASYKIYMVDGKAVHIEGFYFNRENEAGYQDWKDQQDGDGK